MQISQLRRPYRSLDANAVSEQRCINKTTILLPNFPYFYVTSSNPYRNRRKIHSMCRTKNIFPRQPLEIDERSVQLLLGWRWYRQAEYVERAARASHVASWRYLAATYFSRRVAARRIEKHYILGAALGIQSRRIDQPRYGCCRIFIMLAGWRSSNKVDRRARTVRRRWVETRDAENCWKIVEILCELCDRNIALI